MQPNAYEVVLSWFITPLTAILGQFADFFLYSLHAQLVFNSLVSLAFMVFAYERLKEQNLFSKQTILETLFFVGFFALFNYALNHIDTFYILFKKIIFALPDLLTNSLAQSLENQMQDTLVLRLDFLFNYAFSALTFIWDLAHKEWSLWLILGILQALFLSVMFALIILVWLEVHVWCSLGVLFLAFGFFKTWRSVLWICFKKCLALGFYKPLILLVGFLNAYIMQVLMNAQMHAREDLALLLLVALFCCLGLIISVPFFINVFFKTHNSIRESIQLITTLSTNLSQAVSSSFNQVLMQSTHSQNSQNASKERETSTHSPTFRVETTTIMPKIVDFKQKKVKKDTIEPEV
ncbi:conjugal transfer protein TrbL [Helicobacter cetorum]|uniref:conjugal transfer protein TrbL n=1 Tax=Helicobacter cetorum TaxID=138563 RepID=UPI000CF1103F|nr:conjugal transfer protein TrbL [Helicobacter cetorum]